MATSSTSTEDSTSDSSTDNPAGGKDSTSPTTSTDTSVIPELVKDKEAMGKALAGSNPQSGSEGALVEKAKEDDSLGALAMALRTSTPGSFQPLAADLRSVEASINGALALRDALNNAGLKVEVMSPGEYKKHKRETTPEELRGEEAPDQDKTDESPTTTSTRSTKTSSGTSGTTSSSSSSTPSDSTKSTSS